MFAKLIMVGLITAVVVFEVYVITRVVRSSLQKKWRWILLALVGVTQAQLVWSTGAFGYSSLVVTLFGFGVVSHGGGPWIVSVSFPIGAILALRKVEGSLGEAESTSEEEVVAVKKSDHAV